VAVEFLEDAEGVPEVGLDPLATIEAVVDLRVPPLGQGQFVDG
jgi:hypothetical protein